MHILARIAISSIFELCNSLISSIILFYLIILTNPFILYHEF